MKSKEELIKIIENYQELLITTYGDLKFSEPVELSKDNLELFLLDFFKVVRLGKSMTFYTYSTIDESYTSGYSRSRSIGDLFLIARTNYNSKVTLLEVMEAMYNLVDINTERTQKYLQCYIQIYICADINKYVFWVCDSSKPHYLYQFKNYNIPIGYTNHNEFSIQTHDYLTLFYTTVSKEEEDRKAFEIAPL